MAASTPLVVLITLDERSNSRVSVLIQMLSGRTRAADRDGAFELAGVDSDPGHGAPKV
jgi:hypothetical protein